MRASSALLFVVATCAFSSSARAEDKEACARIYTQPQVLRSEHKLIEARARLRECVHSACADFIVKECTTWLAEVEASVPTVALVALDDTGRAIDGVTVSIDGAAARVAADGSSAEMNPGSHTFVFQLPNGATVTREATIADHQRDVRVVATFAAPRAPLPASSSATPAGAPVATEQPSPAQPGRGARTAGLVLGGVGVAAAIAGTYFGLHAMSRWSDAQSACNDATSSCADYANAQSAHDSASSAALISTISFVASGALLIGGALLYFTAPRAQPAPASASVTIAPSVGVRSGGIDLRGSFW